MNVSDEASNIFVCITGPSALHNYALCPDKAHKSDLAKAEVNLSNDVRKIKPQRLHTDFIDLILFELAPCSGF